jgi:hypothetical protein
MKRALILFVCLLLCDAAAADIIKLKSGRVVEGRIVIESPIYVRIETNEDINVQEFLKTKIESIVRDEEFQPSLDEPPSPKILEESVLQESPGQKEIRRPQPSAPEKPTQFEKNRRSSQMRI